MLALAAWVVLLLLTAALLREIWGGAPDAGQMASLVVLILICALCAQYGGDLKRRIKKLGPLELFEEEVVGLLATLEQIEFPSKGERFTPGDVTPDESYHYREADFYISLLEFSNLRPDDGKPIQKYFRLLFNVALSALRQGEWRKAVSRLERLIALSGGSYQPGVVYYNLGMAYLLWALKEPGQKTTHLERAVRSLREAIRHEPDDYLAYFYLAYAQDEQQCFEPAIRSNRRALWIRPQFAPARYNTAVAYVKLGQFKEAYRQLWQIRVTDERAANVFKSALEDDELKALREHREWGPKTTELLNSRYASLAD